MRLLGRRTFLMLSGRTGCGVRTAPSSALPRKRLRNCPRKSLEHSGTTSGFRENVCAEFAHLPDICRIFVPDRDFGIIRHSFYMRKILLLVSVALLYAAGAWAGGRAKYVFYFIGDGMGVNQVNGTETYLAALEGVIGTRSLLFTQFPAVGLVTTFSGTNGVTDSAAAGTALASGRKTKNGTLGLLADLETPVSSVAVWAQKAGAAVGIGTSVSVDHATPAAFYAHVPERGMYYRIGKDLIAANMDFYAGSDFRQPADGSDTTAGGSLFERCAAAGYTVARGYADFRKKGKAARRLILLQPESPGNGDRTCLPYAIDRKPSDLTLAQITRAGLSFLTRRDGGKGFFFMVEGGKIDYACHANDAATAFKETIDMDEAVRVAYEFYEQHPDETLIVITADHETGGIVLGRGPYELHTDLLKFQKMSAEEYTRHLNRLHRKLGGKFTWAAVEKDLKENWGFWRGVALTGHQTERMRKAFDDLEAGKEQTGRSLYAQLGGIADAARRTMAECALIGWQSGGHSNGYVPVFAIGAGAERFAGKMDNTQIPLKIAEAAGYDRPGASAGGE